MPRFNPSELPGGQADGCATKLASLAHQTAAEGHLTARWLLASQSIRPRCVPRLAPGVWLRSEHICAAACWPVRRSAGRTTAAAAAGLRSAGFFIGPPRFGAAAWSLTSLHHPLLLPPRLAQLFLAPAHPLTLHHARRLPPPPRRAALAARALRRHQALHGQVGASRSSRMRGSWARP